LLHRREREEKLQMRGREREVSWLSHATEGEERPPSRVREREERLLMQVREGYDSWLLLGREREERLSLRERERRELVDACMRDR